MSDFILFEANMDAALRRHYLRTGADMVYTEMPYDDLLRSEEDEPDEEIGLDVWRERALGARTMMQRLLAEGPHPQKLLKHLFTLGRALNVEPFNQFTMEEAAMLCGEGKASHSHRLKLLSRLLGEAGMKGTRLPGQKSPLTTASFSAAQRGNRNRANSVRGKFQKEQPNQ
jgi:hypothetical protein